MDVGTRATGIIANRIYLSSGFKEVCGAFLAFGHEAEMVSASDGGISSFGRD